MTDDLDFRQQLAVELLSAGITATDMTNNVPPSVLATSAALAADLKIPFPPGLRPAPYPINPEPQLNDPLPKADVVVVTWTVDEVSALADVLTPQITRDHWYRYARNFSAYLPKIRERAPARNAQRLASYYLTKVGAKTVLCLKSELHLNQDGVQDPPFSPGNASLPVKDLFHQILDEADPSLIITTGTAGAVFAEHDLGDVVVTRGAMFRVQKEFGKAPFAGKAYKSDWQVSTSMFGKAVELMRGFKSQIAAPEFLPPTANYAPLDHIPKPITENDPDIKMDGIDMPAFHPILTTDFFEFGTSVNKLDQFGAAVEMGDAALGLCVEERAATGKSTPNWLVIRNCSDPQINGALRNRPAKQSLQAMWAVYYYMGFGYWTSVNSAITTWAVIAGN
ncbi:hypothetical protein LB516_03475 [Mesorhizobium sp. CO1-1-7]|uniref:hypothetical protein n=1 Tax=Mesorhizobium sp. CO1-1-7 TaxID=2876632 RepID=UPI001CD12887|nr:hypothetical protein [Mesorhizobium sp. CO1-1-7]MBZ9744304.1 hypothetical protein [Mesorhizobium sp. CO1-1-7]